MDDRTLNAPPAIVVTALDESFLPGARALAARLSLPLVEPAAPTSTGAHRPERSLADAPWRLEPGDAGLALCRPDHVRIRADFVRGRGAAHAHEADLAAQPLARALGIAALRARLDRPITLLDMTAGLGVDAWLAATLGAQVTMLERSPIVHALLEDALHRATRQEDERTRRVAARLTLVLADGTHYAGRTSIRDGAAFDLVYLDPMYPQRRVRGGQRKGIEALQALVKDGSGDGLLDAALRIAGARVVVKRPGGALPLHCASKRAPDDTIEGPKTRYDRYRCALSRESS